MKCDSVSELKFYSASNIMLTLKGIQEGPVHFENNFLANLNPV